jgi:hypothetical protein
MPKLNISKRYSSLTKFAHYAYSSTNPNHQTVPTQTHPSASEGAVLETDKSLYDATYLTAGMMPIAG